MNERAKLIGITPLLVVEDVLKTAEYYRDVKSRNAGISEGIVKRSYGREFIIRDIDGHQILVCD